MRSVLKPLAFTVVGLAVLAAFQNCGQTLPDQGSSNSSNGIGTASPGPSPAPNPGNPNPNPAPSPMPAPAPYVLQNLWGAVSAVGAPSPRDKMVSVWTGTQMLIFGGEFYAPNAGLQMFNDGGRYNPSTMTWSPMATAPIAGRREASGVWTGSKMIVFGGYGASNTTFGDGAIYDPASNTWAALPSAGAPSARVFHTAIWTGSKMIIYGGHNYTPPVANRGDGALYDPATNTWSPMSMVGAPQARYAHTAVWTGTKMIVFGGWNASALNDGGIYDPATNSWSPLQTVSAPSVRNGHTAIWTGQQMVVFGGYSVAGTNTVSLAAGAAYNPTSNTWTNISATGAPSARYGHAAVWTGSKMIIHGGFNGSAVLNGGGIYDPATDSWTDLSTINAPSARANHGYVWADTRMIIFGGSGSNSALGDSAYLY